MYLQYLPPKSLLLANMVVGRSILPTRNVGSGRPNGDESRWPSYVGGRQRGLALPQTFATASNGRGSWRSAKLRSARRPGSGVRLLREEQGVHQGYGRLRNPPTSSSTELGASSCCRARRADATEHCLESARRCYRAPRRDGISEDSTD